MDPQGRLSAIVRVTPAHSALLPPNPAQMHSIHRCPGSKQVHETHSEAQEQRRLPGEVPFLTSQSASIHRAGSKVRPGDASSPPAATCWCVRRVWLEIPYRHLGSGPWGLPGLRFIPPRFSAAPSTFPSGSGSSRAGRVCCPQDAELSRPHSPSAHSRRQEG